ncbi:MAG: hypothetical protein JSW00_06200 [Thermoplasmata archaeon]|nr:MAG: hypothetical protein JSW00_06200 [Thermoplasmata archaeon]
MADQTVTVPDGHTLVPLFIKNEHIGRLSTAMKSFFPIPEILNPAYVDEETTPEEPQTIPEYTDGQWGKICIMNWLKNQTKRYEDARDKKAVNNDLADDLVS